MMRSWLALCLLLALVVVPSSAQAWKEPDSFRGIPFGAPEERARFGFGIEGWTCFDGSTAGERVCSRATLNLGDVPTSTDLTFQDDRFVSATMTFKADHFETMRAIFIKRYGPPTKITEEEVRTQAGVSYTNAKFRWNGRKVSVRLYRFLSKVTESYAAVELNEYTEQLLQRGREKTQEGADDL